MAQKPTTTRNLDSDVAKELEDALDFDFTNGDDDLDIAASMEDLEAQISQAADELARESGQAKPADQPRAPIAMPQNGQQNAQTTPPRPANEWHPVPADSAPLQPAGLSPANDDRQKDFRAFRQALNRRASNGIYWMVLLLSLAWASGGVALAYVMFGADIWTIRSVEALLARPYLILLAVAIIVPVILFWGFAVMVRRAQDMRLAAQSMTEVAFRLAEPEALASDRVMMVGQAVRREVAAMGEGIERTLARAVELETLVHTEVNELERAYAQNETRIRGLVDGLGQERDAVVSHSERVRASITGAHETLRGEISSVSDIIRDSILSASTKLSMTITNAGDTLIDRINESGGSIYESIDQRMDALTDRISTSGEAFASLLDTRIAKLTQSTDDVTRSLADMLNERTTDMVSLLGGATGRLNTEFEGRLHDIERTLAERGQALIGEFQTRAEALDTGTQKLNAALEARARQINETLVERAREISSTFSDGRQNLATMIDEGKARIGAEMADIVNSTSTMLEARAGDFAGRLDAARHVVSRAFDADIQRLTEARAGIDEAVENHSRKLAEGRDRMAAALHADLQKFAEGRSSIEGAVGLHVQKLSEGRALVAKAVEEDLGRISEARSSIDAALEGQLNRLHAGRENLASALNDDLHKLDQTKSAIDQMVAGHVGKLSEGRGILTRALEADLDKLAESRSGIDGLVAGQVEKLAQGREILNRALEADLAKLAETRAGIDGLVASQVEKLAEGRDVLTHALEADLKKLTESRAGIDGLVSGQVEKLAQGRDILSRALAADLKTLADNRVSIDETVAGHVAKLADGRNMLARALDDDLRKLSETRAELDDIVQVHAHALADRRNEISDLLAADIGKIEDAFRRQTGVIEERTGTMERALSAGVDNVRQVLEKSAVVVAGALREKVLEVTAALTQEAGNAFSDADRKLAQRAETTSSALMARATEISNAFDQAERELASRADANAKALVARTNETAEQLSARAEATAGLLSARAQEIAGTFDEADQRLAARAAESASVLADRAGDILRNFDDADQRLSSRIGESAEALAARAAELSRIFDAADARLATRISESDATLGARANDIVRSFEQADDRLMARVSETADAIGGRAIDLANVFDAIDHQIATRVGESAEALGARTVEIEGVFNDAEQRIISRTGDLAGVFNQAEQQIIARTHLTSAELAERALAIEQALASADQRMAEGAESAAARVAIQVGEVERRLAGSAETMTQKINEQVSEAEAHLVSRANVISETFAAVGEHIGKSTNDAAKTIGVNTRELNAMLAARSAEITKILDETARPLVDRFTDSGGELQRSLEAATQQATERLRTENATLVNAMANRTAETLAALDGARSTLSDNVDDLISRLSASSSQLNVLVEAAKQNLLIVDDQLSGTTDKFASTTEKAAQTFATSARLIDANTNRLTELSQAALREVAAIANRFDEHGRLLANASNLIGAAQSNFEHTLERQSSLEDLAVGLVNKSEELERVMKSFENLVGSALEKAEGRTLESTDKIRNSITEVVESATRRFGEATEDMRRTAQSIRSELEETRAELKKGVIEMPVEAKESTTAIRRAVSEQINALKELSDIVAKSGRMFDVSDRGSSRSAPPPPSMAPIARAPEQRRPAPPLATERRAPAAEPALRGTIDLERPAESNQPRPGNGQSQQGGWVRDLLRGASRDEEVAEAPAEPPPPARAAGAQRSPLHVVESLNSLSVDIARAIDHEASIELWDRYRRGERDVFTRRLYTLKGQQTFDEIRRKYQNDPDFHAAVDRYCDDFEKLLKDIARNDRDNIMTQTYLTSDTGKVYTMLAHAAGRLR